MLFGSLATLEFTELRKLVDDTSNDFFVLNAQQTGSAVVRQNFKSEPKTNPTSNDSRRPTVRRTAVSVSYIAKDFLQFLCIMRT